MRNPSMTDKGRRGAVAGIGVTDCELDCDRDYAEFWSWQACRDRCGSLAAAPKAKRSGRRLLMRKATPRFTGIGASYAQRMFGNGLSVDVQEVHPGRYRASVSTDGRSMANRVFGANFQADVARVGDRHYRATVSTGKKPLTTKGMRGVGRHYHTWKDLAAPELHGPCGWDAYQCGWYADETPMCCPYEPGRPGVTPPKRGTVAARFAGVGQRCAPEFTECTTKEGAVYCVKPAKPGWPPRPPLAARLVGVGAHRAVMSPPGTQSFGNWVGTMPLVHGGAFAAHQRRVLR